MRPTYCLLLPIFLFTWAAPQNLSYSTGCVLRHLDHMYRLYQPTNLFPLLNVHYLFCLPDLTASPNLVISKPLGTLRTNDYEALLCYYLIRSCYQPNQPLYLPTWRPIFKSSPLVLSMLSRWVYYPLVGTKWTRPACYLLGRHYFIPKDL